MDGEKLGRELGKSDFEGARLGFELGGLDVEGKLLGGALGEIERDGKKLGLPLGKALSEGILLGIILGNCEDVGAEVGCELVVGDKELEGTLLGSELSLGLMEEEGAAVGLNVGSDNRTVPTRFSDSKIKSTGAPIALVSGFFEAKTCSRCHVVLPPLVDGITAAMTIDRLMKSSRRTMLRKAF